MIGIHDIHRKMAVITQMNIDEDGILQMDSVTIMQLIPLLKKNFELVWKHDALKNLALEAQIAGDMRWVQEICEQIEELELQMI
jgi:acyl carrier protein